MSDLSGSGLFDAKECPDCRELKPLSEFGHNRRMADGRARYCKACFGRRHRASYRKRMTEKGRIVKERPEVPEGFKFCPECGGVKPHSEFGRNRAEKSGMTAYCKPCHNRVMAEIKTRKHGSVRNYHLKRRYGVTAAEIDEIRERQGGICVICLRNPAVHVDHNHETGLLRGLLCFSCNGGLGQFADESFRLRQAAAYLEGEISHSRLMELEFGESMIDGFAGRDATRARRTRSNRPGSSRHDRRTRYGIGDGGVRRILAVQRDLCPICSDARGEHVDHCHRTGVVRGVLCPACNTGMGQFGDDPIALRRAADYLDGRLVERRFESDGRTRLSFTIPDVHPDSVPGSSWERHRIADGQQRKAIIELSERLQRFRWLQLVVDEAYPHHARPST